MFPECLWKRKTRLETNRWTEKSDNLPKPGRYSGESPVHGTYTEYVLPVPCVDSKRKRPVGYPNVSLLFYIYSTISEICNILLDDITGNISKSTYKGT